MKNVFLYITVVTGTVILLISSCKESKAPEGAPPGKVRLVPKSPETALQQSGINAVALSGTPGQNGIYLEWYASSGEGIRSYEIYRRRATNNSPGDSVGTYESVKQNNNVNDTTFTDNTAETEQLYFYYVTATNDDGLASDPSAKEQFRLLPVPIILSPVSGALVNEEFRWLFDDVVPQVFYFRLERQTGESYEPLEVRQLNTEGNVNPEQSRTLSEMGLQPLSSGFYRWRIEISNGKAGAVSQWGRFSVN